MNVWVLAFGRIISGISSGVVGPTGSKLEC
jgi:hypothetical protein